MGIVTANLAISRDGFTAGPNQGLERPFGTGADTLTAWMFQAEEPGRRSTSGSSLTCTQTPAPT